MIIEWNDEITSGIEEIDRQHKQIINRNRPANPSFQCWLSL